MHQDFLGCDGTIPEFRTQVSVKLFGLSTSTNARFTYWKKGFDAIYFPWLQTEYCSLKKVH
jgi:hypothetical protein